MVEAATPLFMLGVMRSGTTYFRNVLGSNPQVLVLDSELNNFWTEHGAPCGAVEECVPLSSDDCDLKTARSVQQYFYRRYIFRNSLKHLGYRAYRKFRYGNESLSKRGAPFYLLNKSTHLLNKVKYVDAIFPNAKYIFLVRDVYSQSYSLYKHFKCEEQKGRYKICHPIHPNYCWSYYENHMKAEGSGWSFHDLPDYWVNHNYLAMCDLNAVAEGRVMYVRYADLVDDLSLVLDRVATFLGLYSINKAVSTKLINNRSVNPLTQWQDGLSNEQLSIIDAVIAQYERENNYIQSCLEGEVCRV